MNPETIRHLNSINRAFYNAIAEDFDQTRGEAWPGWDRLRPHLEPPLRALDVGCGNGRFGLFLCDHLPPEGITYHGVDNNSGLLDFAHEALQPRIGLRYMLTRSDVVEGVLPGGDYDLIVAFGLLHHIPGAANRQALIRALAGHLAPGGLLAFACWRFYEYARFVERITPWPNDLAGQVEPGDYLLDWRRGHVALRYCHYIDDAEHQALVAASGLHEVESWRADGHSGEANRYSLLRKDESSVKTA
jgi:SAM-dependent methyltransferase